MTDPVLAPHRSHLLHTLAADAGALLQDLQDLQHRALAQERRLRLAKTQAQLATQAHAANTLAQALPALLDTLCRHIGAQAGHVFLHSADSRSLVSSGVWWSASDSPPPAWADQATPVPLATSDALLAPALACERPHVLHTAEPAAAGRAGWACGQGMPWGLAFGFQVAGHLHAVVECFSASFTAPADELLAVAKMAVEQMARLAERQRLDQLKDDFVHTVSHELRTPLTSIAGSLELLAAGRGGALPDRAMSLAQMALRNSLRLTRLVNDILELGRIEAGRFELTVAPTDLVPLIERAIEENQAYASTFQVALQAVACEGPAQAHVDEDRMLQILTNLLSNAAKFSPAGACVDVLLQRVHGHWRVSVCDRGPGIPLEFQAQVFNKFAQASGTTAQQPGSSGLGLAIVKRLVEAMQGSVGFSSQPGQGTVFHVLLPALD